MFVELDGGGTGRLVWFFRMLSRRFNSLPAVLLILAGLLIPAAASAEIGVPPPNQPNRANQPNQQAMNRVLKIARNQLRRKVSERRGNNVPRYRNGRGRIAPYSIRDQWCVAFGTWVWNRAGFRDYLGASLIWSSHDRTPVAVQVTDMSSWAKRTGHWSARARPGYLVAYDFSHIGIVMKADRNGRAVAAIEGNKGNRVRKVRVPMTNVTGYISPTELSQGQIVNAIANPDMVVPSSIAEDPMAFAVASTDD